MRAPVGLVLLLATSSCAHQRAARFDVATCPPPDSLNTDTLQGPGRDVSQKGPFKIYGLSPTVGLLAGALTGGLVGSVIGHSHTAH